MTRHLAIDPDRPDPAAIAEAAAVIRAGGLVAFGTETVYGLGADATNPAAVARIFAAKGRPSTNPLIVHVDGPAMARTCVAAWPEMADRLVAALWPGPLTLVLPRSPLIPDLVTAARGTVGVRMPASPVALALIAAAGRPIAAPSANRSNRISPTTAGHVLKDLDGRIDLILDAGPARAGIESTVLDLAHGPPHRILRPGPIGEDDLRPFGLEIGTGAMIVPEATPQASPGQLAVHYAPRTPALRMSRDAAATFAWPARAGLIVVGHEIPPALPDRIDLVILPTPERAAAALYATLHRLDDLGVDLIAVIPPPDEPRWRAVLDRITRATRPHTDPSA